jgi:mycothiol synthase
LASSSPAPPTGYAARAASYEDLAGIDELYAAADRALSVPVVPVSGDLRWRWSQPTFDIVRDTWVLVGDGHLVGFGMVSVPDDAPMIARVTARVHPAHTGRGLGSWLLRSLERSARDREGVSVCRQTYVPDRDAAGQRLLEAHGYRRVRATVDMGVALEPPIDVDPPDGVVIRPFEPGEERVAWRLEVDAFREARGRGVGTALLRRAMSDAAAAGYREMTLSVDAASPTGAVHAYEKAGMTVRRGDLIYDKELR